MANNVVNFKRGTAAQYNAATKDADTLYFVTSSGGSSSVEMGELFLGSIRIGVGIGTSADPSTNKTYYGLKNYVDSSFVSAVAEGNANGKIAVTKNGTTTQISVHGLGTAAYTASTDYATSAQGAKADSAVQDIHIDDSSTDTAYFLSATKGSSDKVVTISATVYNGGAIPLTFDQTNGLVASLSSSYVSGSLTTNNKLLTQSVGGQLGVANTWTGNNTFSGSLTATDGVSLSADSGDISLSVSPSGIELNSRYGVHIYSPDAGSYIISDAPIQYAAGVAPIDNQDLVTKTYVDSMVSSNLRYVGDSTTVPTAVPQSGTGGATVPNLPAGFTWKIGDVVTCNVSGYTGKEYILYQQAAGTTVLNDYRNWRELGDESTYALKTTTISGTNGITVTAGGTLGQNTTLGISTTVVDGDTTTISSSNKILTQGSTYIKSVSGDNAISVTTTSKAASISLSLDSTSGQLDFTKGTNGLYASLKSSYVEGTLSTTNKLITVSYGDGRYGRLTANNTWQGSNTFSSGIDVSDADTVFSASTTSGVSIGYFGYTVGMSGTITVDSTDGTISWGGTPSTGDHLTNKSYVDSAITTALTWASI